MRLLIWVLGLGLLGCGGQANEPLQPARAKPSLSRPATEPSDQLGIFGGGTVGPYLGPTRDGWLAIWVSPDGEGANWTVRKIDHRGHMMGPATVVGRAQAETRLLKWVNLGDELLVLFTEERLGAERVGALSLTHAGQLAAAPQQLATAANDVIWLEAVAVGPVAIVFWAERKEDRVTLHATRWDPGAPPARTATRVHAEARAWQVVAWSEGALLGAVTPGGEVEVLDIDVRAKVRRTTTLPDSQGANADLDLVPSVGGFMVAYSRGASRQRRLVTQRLSARGEPQGAAVFPTEPATAQQLVRLVESAGRVLLVWQQGTSPTRAAWLGADARVHGEVIELAGETGDELEFGSNGQGVAALLGAGCAQAPCSETTGVQWFEAPLTAQRVQRWSSLDDPARGTPTVATGSEQSSAELVWGLSCGAKACAGLSAQLQVPIAVKVRVSAPAASRPLDVRAQPKAAPREAWPRLVELQQDLAQDVELADVAGLARKDGALLAWVTQFDPNTPYVKPERAAPDGRWAPVQALLQTQWAPAGSELPPPEVISYRARSVAGVALAEKGDRALLVWSAIDGKSPQVFTTLLDQVGKRVRQAVQTTKQGEVYELGTCSIADGWALAWIDDRSGQPLSYVAKLNDRLKRLSADQQLPRVQGQARDLLVGQVGDETWVLVVEAADAHAILLQRFDAGFLPVGPSMRLVTDPEPLSSPVVLDTGGHAVLLWISGEGSQARGWFQPLDAQGEAEGPVAQLPRGGVPHALGGDCEPGAGCVYWVSERHDGRGRVRGGVATGSAVGELRILFDSAGPGVPRVQGDGSQLWSPAGPKGLQRATVRWRP
jgi:hypothetical protein